MAETEKKTKLTPEDKATLMEYMLNGRIQKEYKILDVPVVLQTITVRENLAAKEEMSEVNPKAIGALLANEFQVQLLKYSLKQFNDIAFDKPEDADIFIRNSGDHLVDKLVQKQTELHKYVHDILEMAEDFSESPSSSSD